MTFPFVSSQNQSHSSAATAPQAQPTEIASNAMTQAMQASTTAMSNGLMGLEAVMAFSRNASALGLEWCSELAKCPTPFEAANVNARYLERSWNLWRSLSQEVANDASLFVTPPEAALDEKGDGGASCTQRLYG